MISTKRLKTPFFLLLVVTLLGHGWAASLEHGKVRARERGWLDMKPKPAAEKGEPAIPIAEPMEVTFEEESPVDELPEAAVEIEQPVEAARKSDASDERVRPSPKLRGKLQLISRQLKKGPTFADGYLAVGSAPVLRFSDIDPINARPPSPALPEFNFVSSEFVPYLIEEALPEDALNDNSLLAELVIEMEPHTVVSGMIDTRRHRQEEQVEDFHLEEQRTTVLRPEEILIFFETDTNVGSSGAVIPFSPATPNPTTVKSSATLNKE